MFKMPSFNQPIGNWIRKFKKRLMFRSIRLIKKGNWNVRRSQICPACSTNPTPSPTQQRVLHQSSSNSNGHIGGICPRWIISNALNWFDTSGGISGCDVTSATNMQGFLFFHPLMKIGNWDLPPLQNAGMFNGAHL